MAKGVMIVAEQRDGALRKISFELASTARKLADQTGDEVSAVLLGSGVEAMAAELGKYGVDKVFVGDNAALEPYVTEAHAEVTAKVIKDNDPAIVLFGASVQGKDLSARVAAKLATGLATDCTDVKIDGGKLVCTRPMYAGKCFGEVVINAAPQIASLRPNVFPAVENAKAGAVTKVDVAVGEQKSKILEVQKDTSGKVDLTEANVIVSGGRGMKGPEGYAILEELADVLKGTVGASACGGGCRLASPEVIRRADRQGRLPNLYIAWWYFRCYPASGRDELVQMHRRDQKTRKPRFCQRPTTVVDDLFKVVPR